MRKLAQTPSGLSNTAIVIYWSSDSRHLTDTEGMRPISCSLPLNPDEMSTAGLDCPHRACYKYGGLRWQQTGSKSCLCLMYILLCNYSHSVGRKTHGFYSEYTPLLIYLLAVCDAFCQHKKKKSGQISHI